MFESGTFRIRRRRFRLIMFWVSSGLTLKDFPAKSCMHFLCSANLLYFHPTLVFAVVIILNLNVEYKRELHNYCMSSRFTSFKIKFLLNKMYHFSLSVKDGLYEIPQFSELPLFDLWMAELQTPETGVRWQCGKQLTLCLCFELNSGQKGKLNRHGYHSQPYSKLYP